jgi:hypothetical protein
MPATGGATIQLMRSLAPSFRVSIVFHWTMGAFGLTLSLGLALALSMPTSHSWLPAMIGLVRVTSMRHVHTLLLTNSLMPQPTFSRHINLSLLIGQSVLRPSCPMYQLPVYLCNTPRRLGKATTLDMAFIIYLPRPILTQHGHPSQSTNIPSTQATSSCQMGHFRLPCQSIPRCYHHMDSFPIH